MAYHQQRFLKQSEVSLEEISATLTDLTGGLGASLTNIEDTLERIANALEALAAEKGKE